MRQRKRKWKVVPKMTPFEKRRALEIEQILKDGLDPFGVEIHSGDGSHFYTYNDVANYLEYSHTPFKQMESLFKLGDKGEAIYCS